jgi:hypothetical protein
VAPVLCLQNTLWGDTNIITSLYSSGSCPVPPEYLVGGGGEEDQIFQQDGWEKFVMMDILCVNT